MRFPLRPLRVFSSSFCLATTLVLPLSLFSGAHAQNLGGTTLENGTEMSIAPVTTVLVDNFETGVGAWTRNDKNKAGLADIIRTAPGGAPRSAAAALVTFKVAQNSWASLSRPVDGAQWSKVGAQRLTFWLSGNGDKQGVAIQLRARTGGVETVFSLPMAVNLERTNWRRVVIPLADFKGPKGEALLPRLNNVYLLQFSQSGSWDSRFFNLDDIVIEGNGKPINVPPPPKPTPTPAPVVTPAPPASGSVAVGADFLRTTGPIKALANISVGESYAQEGAPPVLNSPAFRKAIGTLKPKFVRLDVAALTVLADSSKPSFDYGALLSAARQVRSIGAEPLVVISNPAGWGLDAHGYSVLAAGAARALNLKGGPAARYFELAAYSSDLGASGALELYNGAYSALKGVSKQLRVGGFSASADNRAAQSALLKGARGLDFLTVSYFSASQGTPEDAALLQDARDIPALKIAAGLLDKSRFAKVALFVTQANVSAARSPGDYVPSDIRLVQTLSSAWWAQYMASGSRLADQIFHNDAVNPEWGLLDPAARAYPAYYSMWLWNTFFPGGSQRVSSTSANEAVFVAAANTSTSHNMLLVNTTNKEQTAQVTIRGFPVLRDARIRIFDDPQQTVRFATLPKSPFQTVKLAPYAVAVLQFIEPPKK